MINLESIKIPLPTVAALVIAAFSAFFWAESRYASADDVKSVKQQIERTAIDMRKKQLEDRIFEIELIPESKRSDAQRAMLSRYKSELEALNKK